MQPAECRTRNGIIVESVSESKEILLRMYVYPESKKKSRCYYKEERRCSYTVERSAFEARRARPFSDQGKCATGTMKKELLGE